MSDLPPPPPPPPGGTPPPPPPPGGPPPEGSPDPAGGQPQPGVGQPSQGAPEGYGHPPEGTPQGYGQPPQGNAGSGYGQPPAGYGYPVGTGGPAPSTSTLAISSLVTALFGLLCCTSAFVVSIAAVVLGFMARREINDSGGLKTGDGLAIAGMVVGGIGVIIGLVTWILRLSGVIGYGITPF